MLQSFYKIWKTSFFKKCLEGFNKFWETSSKEFVWKFFKTLKKIHEKYVENFLKDVKLINAFRRNF
jgi:hypothetical protein